MSGSSRVCGQAGLCRPKRRPFGPDTRPSVTGGCAVKWVASGGRVAPFLREEKCRKPGLTARVPPVAPSVRGVEGTVRCECVEAWCRVVGRTHCGEPLRVVVCRRRGEGAVWRVEARERLTAVKLRGCRGEASRGRVGAGSSGGHVGRRRASAAPGRTAAPHAERRGRVDRRARRGRRIPAGVQGAAAPWSAVWGKYAIYRCGGGLVGL